MLLGGLRVGDAWGNVWGVSSVAARPKPRPRATERPWAIRLRPLVAPTPPVHREQRLPALGVQPSDGLNRRFSHSSMAPPPETYRFT